MAKGQNRTGRPFELARLAASLARGDDDCELHNKNPPTPCLWQAPASTQKTKRKTRPAILRSARGVARARALTSLRAEVAWFGLEARPRAVGRWHVSVLHRDLTPPENLRLQKHPPFRRTVPKNPFPLLPLPCHLIVSRDCKTEPPPPPPPRSYLAPTEVVNPAIVVLPIGFITST